ncbi:protein NPG1-like [Abrus precatorius]|uniref:Protein NPG1-like n=1 Tax=Abrus precatorius TaxID=3816 RepID=A0A8B8KW36_ABRPR|nr:protein NPG1-like [Abrus precatorius]
MESGENERVTVREFCANGSCVKATEVEAKLDEGNIQEAEAALREGLSINSEEARALLGKLEYQRGNVEGALRVFDGIDLQAAIQRLQSSLSEKPPVKKGPTRSESPSSVSQHAASLVLEAIYLKAKSLQKLRKFTEAATECKRVLDAVEKIFCEGIPDTQVDNKLQEIVSHAVELLPELWKQAGCYNEALSAYRNALLSQWNLDNECCARIQKAFAVFLLYSGVEASPPTLAVQIEGSYVPKNNLEEAILLLMIVLRKFSLGKTKWDPSIMEHLTFALSACGQTSILGKQFEELMPGVYHRIDRWNSLALCHSGAGENKTALNLLRMALHKHERPNDLVSLLFAARICSEDPHLAAEGAGYAQRAIDNALGIDDHLKGVGLRMLGLCLGKQANVASSDFERSMLQSKALQSLDEAVRLEQNNSDLIFELAIQYAKHRNLTTALRYAKQFFDRTGGSKVKGWRLLALVLSAQKRYSEAEVVTDAALDETAKWEQGILLKLKAQLKFIQLRPMDAIEIYRYLLALVQAEKKSFGSLKHSSQVDDDKINEYDVWHGLANLYVSLSHWKDAEICLQKATELQEYSAPTIHTEAVILEGRGQNQEALAATANAVLFGPNYVQSKNLMANLMLKMSSKALPVARSLLSDALRIEPTNHLSWFYLGLTHKDDGRVGDAADCFQAAFMLQESDPIENFSSLL